MGSVMNGLSIKLTPNAVRMNVQPASKVALFDELALIGAANYGCESEAVKDRLKTREALGSTGFGGGVAIPHAKISGLSECVAIVMRLTELMPYEAHDNEPVDIIFCLLSPVDSGAEHLKALAEVSRFMRDEKAVGKLRGAESDDALYAILSGQNKREAA